MKTQRTASIMTLANKIAECAEQKTHPLRVAIDGRTASGKTTHCAELQASLSENGKKVIATTIDGFHNPKAIRYAQGRKSPKGYYEDARNLAAIRTLLLEPLGPDGNLNYATACFDLENDTAIEPQMMHAGADDILLVDGTFLQRPELNLFWDFIIFVDVPEWLAMERGAKRDADMLGGEKAALETYQARYVPAFAYYLDAVDPFGKANCIWNNEDFSAPIVTFSDG